MREELKMKSSKTVTQFKRQAERIFRNGNREAGKIKITWTHAARVTWADQTDGFSGVATVEAAGFRTRNIIASEMTDGLSVR